MRSYRTTADIVAMTAIIWVAAAMLHEGLGHGVACWALGGDPVLWSTFHFDCAKQSLSLTGWRIVAGAGTMVNLALMALGLLWWRMLGRGQDASTARLAAWILVVINGLTSFGYLVFSAAFGIGDWNTAGVMQGVANVPVARGALAIVGVAGYYGVVRLAAAMMSRMAGGATMAGDVRRLTLTVWLTTGVVSLLAGSMAGSDWRSTLGAAIGVALGGNAGLLSIARFVTPAGGQTVREPQGHALLWAAAVVAVIGFVAILGPGVPL